MSWNGFGKLNLADVQEAGDPVLQPGKYIVTCDDAVVEDGRNPSDKRLVLTFKAPEGQLRSNLNIHNKSAQATEIALRQLKSFLVSAGHSNPDQPGDVSTLKGLQVGIIVGEGKPYTNKEGNSIVPKEVKRFFPVEKFDDIVVQEQPRRARAASAAQQQSAQNKAMMDDEIPF